MALWTLRLKPHGAGASGIFWCIGVSADNAGAVKAVAERYADVDCSVGIHPLDVKPGEMPPLDWLLKELDHPRVVAIGETGLDYHYEPEAAELQQASFRVHLEAARITEKPVIIHTRGARADTLSLLREAALPHAGVLHCFTEDWDMAKAALDMGYYISLSGIVTFRNADALRDCWSKPTRRTSRLFLIAANRICRNMCVRWPSFWRCCAASPTSGSQSRPPPTLPVSFRWPI